MNEFELIREFFAAQPVQRADIALGIGDDAAVLDVPPGHQLVVSTDMLLGGVHFPEGTAASAIGHKALAVNLSDLAAMGADPAWFTLNLSLPETNREWLQGYCDGMFKLARQHNVALVGGDTTRGPLSLGIQIMGLVPKGMALTRSGACKGDRIYVTGNLGEGALGLAAVQGRLQMPEEFFHAAIAHLEYPVPRVSAGQALRGIASACIDISDGLLGDLGHILEASGVGARIHLPLLPLSPGYDAVFQHVGWQPALAGGDDYELCFTVSPANEDVLLKQAARLGVAIKLIGEIEGEPGLRIMNESGGLYTPDFHGYDHFRVS